MSIATSAISNVGAPKPQNLKLEVAPTEVSSSSPGDAAQFRAALDRHMSTDAVSGAKAPSNDAGKGSLGDKVMGRANDLASGIKKDEVSVSKALEQATRSGDTMQLMRAMMAMNDYQLKVQAISKVVSKGISSVDTLTKLQ